MVPLKWPEQPGHMFPDLRLLSCDPSDLPDAKSESIIVEILDLHFENNLWNGGHVTFCPRGGSQEFYFPTGNRSCPPHGIVPMSGS